MGPLVNRLIWEAPLKNQQTYLIQQFGPNVNLGNIPTGEALALEALRAGLRFETFYRIAAEMERTGQWNPDIIEEPDTPDLARVGSSAEIVREGAAIYGHDGRPQRSPPPQTER